MTLKDEQNPARGSGGGAGGRRLGRPGKKRNAVGRPGKKRNAADSESKARQPDPLRRLVSSAGPERAPDFFCVGGDPTSMVRLWHMLRHHPSVGVPIPPNAKHSAKAGSDAKLADLSTIADLLVEPAAISAETAHQVATELRLAIGTDRAYLRIFGGMSHPTVGEMSAHPSMITAAGVRRMQRLAPAAKVILLLDDPVERVISTATAAAVASGTAVTADAIADRARRLTASKQTISAGIEHHRVAFGEQLYIAFSADIVSRPASLLESLATILGIDLHPSKDPTEGAVEPTATPELAPRVRRELYAALAEEYAALSGLYPDAVAKWRSRQEDLIGG